MKIFFILLTGIILSAYACADLNEPPAQLWNKTVGGSSSDYAYDVAVDSDGNIVVAGETWSFGQEDACPVFSPLLNLEPDYARYLHEGPVSREIIKIFNDNKISLSDKANITREVNKYWRLRDGKRTYKIKDAGMQLNVYPCPSGEMPEAGSMWGIKLNSGGSILWNKTVGTSFSDDSLSRDYAHDVAVDSNNNIIITGTRTIKYDPYGNVLWDKAVSGDDVAVDADNNVIINHVGEYGDVLVAKYNPEGIMLWNKTAGGKYQRGESIAVDSENNIILTGQVWSLNESGSDAWTIKYDSSGNVLWNKTAGGNDYDVGFDVSVDSKNNVIITGVTGYKGGMFGKSDGVWTIKYDSSGNMLWNKTAGGTGYDSGYGVSTDVKDNIIVTGTMNSSGLWVIKYDSEGNMLWNKTADGPSGGQSVAIDSNGSIIIAGWLSFSGAGKEDVWVIKYALQESALSDSGMGSVEEENASEEELSHEENSEKPVDSIPVENTGKTQDVQEKDSPLKTYLMPVAVISGIILFFYIFLKLKQ